MDWIKNKWPVPINQGTGVVYADGYTLKGVLGAHKITAQKWALVWIKKNLRIVELPTLGACKEFGGKVLPLFGHDGELKDAALADLKKMAMSLKRTEATRMNANDAAPVCQVADLIPRMTKKDLPNQNGQKPPVTADELNRFALLNAQYVGGKEIGLHKYRFVRSHYTTVEIVIDTTRYESVAIYEALDVILWSRQGFDPDYTIERLIDDIKSC